MTSTLASTNLLLAFIGYAIGAASPGPSNLAVMHTALHHGRRAGLTFALGVAMGSTLWGFIAAFGVASLLTRYAQCLVVLKVLGGMYLLWLALKAARSACASSTSDLEPIRCARESDAKLFARGTAMHLTNPKAVFVWLSIVALALPGDAQRQQVWLVVAGCAVIAVVIFGGYALAFSTPFARQVHSRLRRWFDGALALVFACAGFHMLSSK